jgi:DNA gyrase/topoisomerase IV subunit A
MRYTEIRLDKIAHEMLRDIDKETVDFGPELRRLESEPSSPARIPNLLVNGSSGIAVGMATNIPPHNLGEVVDAIKLYVGDHDVGLDELMKVLPGRTFRPPAAIYGVAGIRQAYETGAAASSCAAGHGREHPKRKDRLRSSSPSCPTRSTSAAHRGDRRLVRDKRSRASATSATNPTRRHRDGARAQEGREPGVILNNLYKFTKLQTTFGVNAWRSSAPAAGAAAEGHAAALRRFPARGRGPPHAVRSAKKAESAPTSSKVSRSRSTPRRGHRADPRREDAAEAKERLHRRGSHSASIQAQAILDMRCSA